MEIKQELAVVKELYAYVNAARNLAADSDGDLHLHEMIVDDTTRDLVAQLFAPLVLGPLASMEEAEYVLDRWLAEHGMVFASDGNDDVLCFEEV